MRDYTYALTQQTVTCPKSTIETLEKGMKYVQSQQQRQQIDVNDIIAVSLMSFLLTLNIFYTFL